MYTPAQFKNTRLAIRKLSQENAALKRFRLFQKQKADKLEEENHTLRQRVNKLEKENAQSALPNNKVVSPRLKGEARL